MSRPVFGAPPSRGGLVIPSKATRTLLRQLFAELDYPRLGEIYCEEGGEAFWDAHREPARRLGEVWAAALARRLRREGNSLYVGAGVAELAAMVTEVCDLARTVVATNLDAACCGSLNTSLEKVGLGDRIRILAEDASSVADGREFDHVSVVSVLNDPICYPTVSAVGYGRVPPVALDVREFDRERTVVRALVERLLAALSSPATVTTTFEEVSWFLAAAEVRHLAIEADDEVIETAIVGDELGFLRVTRRRD